MGPDPEERVADRQRRLAERKPAAAGDEAHPDSEALNPGQRGSGATPAPGWYPQPGGEPGTRYWDGHTWTAVNTWRNKRGHPQIAERLGAFLAAALGVLVIGWGAHDLNQYRVGAPTTATVTHCSGRGGCDGTWSIGEVSQSGHIERDFSNYPVGSSVDVRVRGGTAYTEHAWVPAVLFGGLLLAGPLVALFSRVFRRSSG